MIDPENHTTPVDDPTLWQRPEHLAARMGVSVRTLRKWASKGRAERRRDREGQVFYRLLSCPDDIPQARQHHAHHMTGHGVTEQMAPLPPLVLPPVMVPEPGRPVPEPTDLGPGPEAEADGVLVDRLLGINQRHEAHIAQLHAAIATVQEESARSRALVVEATENYERLQAENEQLRSEIRHHRELVALPWWSKKRRRDVTIPMTSLDGE